MFKSQTEMEAIPVSQPQLRTVFNPVTLNEDPHLCYDAEIQYKRKDPQVRMIMCGTLDHVKVGVDRAVVREPTTHAAGLGRNFG